MSVQTKRKLALISRQLALIVAVVGITAFATTAIVSQADDKSNMMPSEADMAKGMEMMMKMGAPGPEHELLKKFNGEWKVTSKCYMPGQDPSETKGENDNEMMLGGRYSHQRYEGYIMMPGKDGNMERTRFDGVGVMGYDNFKKEYYMVWMDNFSTMVYTGTGQYNPATKELVLYSSAPDPMSNMEIKRSKWVTRIESPNRYVFEMHSETTPNNWMKCMEMEYVRDD